MAIRKVFVGSLPDGITDNALRAEFSKYGHVEDVFVKPNCEPSRQWAFVTFATQEQAQLAKESCDRQLVFPGADRPCDVMLAKNQGMFGQSGVNPQTVPPPQHHGGYTVPPQTHVVPAQPKKIFVGSLPDGIPDASVRAEFSKYGMIEDMFVKQGCEPGRQWAFVTYSSPEQARHAQEMTNGTLMFPGSIRACEVTLARNQGMFGQEPLSLGPATPHQAPASYGGYGGGGTYGSAPGYHAPGSGQGPKKIFVGSLPEGISDQMLRAEFSKYGQITDVFLKNGCENGRNWAFVSFASPEQAQLAKSSCDRVLFFPGCEQPCEVTIARHQGMFGQDSDGYRSNVSIAPVQHHQSYANAAPAQDGPKKIFVGSLPDSITDAVLRAEFSKFGQIIDVFLKQGSDQPGRRWAFVTFASSDQAQYAKDATDRILVMPGADKPVEVMLAKNQGKFGQSPLNSSGGGGGGGGYEASQPPPPATPPPAHLTPWRMYRTAAGLPYYHNATTGVTQWECPPELQGGSQRYSPY